MTMEAAYSLNGFSDDLAADDSSHRLFLLQCENKARKPPTNHITRTYIVPQAASPTLFQVSPSDLYDALTAAAAPHSVGKLVELRGAVNELAVVVEREWPDRGWMGGGVWEDQLVAWLKGPLRLPA